MAHRVKLCWLMQSVVYFFWLTSIVDIAIRLVLLCTSLGTVSKSVKLDEGVA